MLKEIKFQVNYMPLLEKPESDLKWNDLQA